MPLNVVGRHPTIQEFEYAFEWDHLPDGLAQAIAVLYHTTAENLLARLPDSPGLTRALHRLWESKNEAVFSVVKAARNPGPESVRTLDPRTDTGRPAGDFLRLDEKPDPGRHPVVDTRSFTDRPQA